MNIDPAGAALIQLAEHAERISQIEAALTRHADVVSTLGGLERQVADLARRIAGLAEDQTGDRASGHQPVPAPRWWNLAGTERDAAIERLRSWVDQVYRPSYGQLAALLPQCWGRHSFCLFTLDWLSELWSVLYLSPRRTAGTLAAQAEWQTRLLPAAADQMARETTRCEHARSYLQRPLSGAHTSAAPRQTGRADWPAD